MNDSLATQVWGPLAPPNFRVSHQGQFKRAMTGRFCKYVHMQMFLTAKPRSIVIKIYVDQFHVPFYPNFTRYLFLALNNIFNPLMIGYISYTTMKARSYLSRARDGYYAWKIRVTCEEYGSHERHFEKQEELAFHLLHNNATDQSGWMCLSRNKAARKRSVEFYWLWKLGDQEVKVASSGWSLSVNVLFQVVALFSEPPPLLMYRIPYRTMMLRARVCNRKFIMN